MPISVIYLGPLKTADPVFEQASLELGPFKIFMGSPGKSIEDLALSEAEFLLLHETPLPDVVLETAEHLLAIIQIGAEAECDLELARELGIFVSDVSSHASESLLGFARGKFEAFNERWDPRSRAGRRIAPRRPRMGLLGLGRLGERLAEAAKQYGFDLWAHDPFALEEVFDRTGAHGTPSMDELLGLSDILLMTLPACDANRGLISIREMELMRPEAWLINLGWGESVDAEAAMKALHEERLGRLIFPEPQGGRGVVAELRGPGSNAFEYVRLEPSLMVIDTERELRAAFTLIDAIARGKEPSSLLIDPPCPRRGQ